MTEMSQRKKNQIQNLIKVIGAIISHARDDQMRQYSFVL